MAAPNITFISDMYVTRDDLTFKLRVINLWHQMSFYNKNEIWSIEMILLDEHGNKIQAMVSKRNLYRFKNVVKDGMTFYIKGPNFAALKTGSFKLTPHDQKFTFVQQTVVTECNNFSRSLFGFSFVDYQAVLSLTHPQDTSVDVMGLVVAIAEIQQGDPEKSKHRLNIRIQDANGLQLHVNLWGEYAYKMLDYINNNPDNRRIVVILQFDRPSVNTYFTSSKLFINSDIDEITNFNKSLDGDDRPDSSTNTFSIIPSNQNSAYDDFMVKNNLKGIAEVWEPVERGDDLGLYSGEINALKGLKLAFKISVTIFNVSNKNNQYGIARISDDETLIEQLENKFTESQDAVSGTDDNITPSTIEKNDTTSPMNILNTTPVLKRNLEEVFDLEINDHLSTTKTLKISPDGPGKQLLKVKLEKND
ncbi:unnamed protein product [Lactuca virosa]|uniref:Replication protein A 70 kDa DNA-binding subunit B/D first OB fold domain-containing protein n=1 Tax=Lactuca virosa TaxID=75947 RepID=A0AAU9LW59_9ASTR|nr:unnamed protein product [Lactuca virosa]